MDSVLDEIDAELECSVLYQHTGQHGTMYGMLMESIQHFIIERYGDDAWATVLRQAGLANTVFATHKRYPDDIMTKLACTCSKVLPGLGIPESPNAPEEYMLYFGTCFVKYFTHYGYDRILKVAGRHYRDFLNGIDNLHETMRFSYPKMLSPSFYVTDEDENGCLLHYRSKRVGFTNYVIGQLQACGRRFYNTDVQISVLMEDITENGCHTIFRLSFDNQAVNKTHKKLYRKNSSVQGYSRVNLSTFLKVFTFSIIFNKDLTITHVGDTLKMLFAQDSLIGDSILSKFVLRRPQMSMNWEDILCLQSVIFEMESTHPIKRLPSIHGTTSSCTTPGSPEATRTLLLKGQMRYLADVGSMAFLCSPLLNNLDEMCSMGLYINDLNMFDSGRDMVMAGWQHASRLEYSIEKQILKSQQIADNLRQLDQWKSRSEDLLYSMIPQQIAVRLKNGEDPISTCEVFEQVTIVFSYLLGFNEMCSEFSPLELVKCFNSVFTLFDMIVDKHKVFKVETLGDAVYMIAGGVPDRRPDHAACVARVALELVDAINQYKLPTKSRQQLQIRIGMHTGSVVAGVVGKRMPQYCLFGDTVNTASRMQTNSMPGRVHISEPCQKQLRNSPFVSVFRGRVNIKGKGQMNTYWLIGLRGNPSTEKMSALLRQEQRESLTLGLTSSTDAYDLHQRRKQSQACIFVPGSPVRHDSDNSHRDSETKDDEDDVTFSLEDSSPTPKEALDQSAPSLPDTLSKECLEYVKHLQGHYSDSTAESKAKTLRSPIDCDSTADTSFHADINSLPCFRQYRSNSIAVGNLLHGVLPKSSECLSRCESAEAHLETLSSSTFPFRVPSGKMVAGNSSHSNSLSELQAANQDADLISFESTNDLTCLSQRACRMTPQLFAMSAKKSLLDMSLDET